MKYIIDHERPGPQVIGSHDPDHFRVLRAIISSSIDVDKLDYVARDALHCGVPYGSIVDHERFVTSLRIWWDKGGLPHLLLSDKGRACAEALVFARYLMTSEVYWNHAVRSYAATLSAAIGQLSKDEVSDHLWDNDDAFLAWLGGKPKTKWLVKLIEDRRPFRRAFVHQKLGGGVAGDDTDERLFNFLEDAAKGEKKVLHSIRQVVAGSLKIANYKEHEIVLDVPAGMTRLSGVQVLAEGHEEPGPVGPIFDAIGVNFDGFARKARIFVRPDLLKGRSVAESTSIVRKALLQEFRLT